MSGTIERLRGRPELSVLPDWSEAGFPVMDTLPETHGIHVEERLTDGTYVLLAELPGVDPSDGIEITVVGGVLDLRAQRSVMTTGNRGTKVLYGHFTPLPAGAKGDEVAAEYKHGVLTITVPVPPADHRRSLRS